MLDGAVMDTAVQIKLRQGRLMVSNKLVPTKKRRTRELGPAARVEMWELYVDGWKQDAIAAEFGVTQGRVSQVLAEYRAEMPETDKAEIRIVLAEQLRAATEAIMPRVRKGEIAAVTSLLRIQERICRMYGLDETKYIPEEANGIVQYIIESDGTVDEDIMKALT